MIGRAWCALTHRRHWKLVERKTTNPRTVRRQRHVGAYRCQVCGRSRRIVGDVVRREDPDAAGNGPPPDRGPAMTLHRLLGGRAEGE